MVSCHDNSRVAWQCEVFADLLVRCWEEEVFIFNPRTGHTHILNDLSWNLLSACADAPQEKSTLFPHLKAAYSVDDVEELDAALDTHLNHLLQLELLTPIEHHGPH